MKTLLFATLLYAATPLTLQPLATASTQSNVSCVTQDGYSDVITDLHNLKLYSPEYISNASNYYIALSEQYNLKNELKTFIYLNYVGSIEDKLEARINTSLNEEDKSKLFTLKVVSYDKNTNLKKYEVENISSLYSTRHYGVNCIQANDSIILDGIEKDYYFNGTNNDNLEAYYNKQEVITITDHQVADICYGDSLNFFFQETGLLKPGAIYNDTWFIFFNTDKKIDDLLEVELTYTQYNFCIGAMGGYLEMETTYTENMVNDFINNRPAAYQGSAYKNDFYLEYEKSQRKVIMPGTKRVNYYGNKKHYEELDNIMNLKEYKESNESDFVFTEYASKYTWGVHFNDTTRNFTQKGANAAAGLITASGVTETAILRLKFETNEKQYNLLAVDTPSYSETNKGGSADIKNVDDDPWNIFLGILQKIIDACSTALNWLVANPWCLWTIIITIIVLLLLPFLTNIINFLKSLFK